MPRLAEYRWFRVLRAASASFSTARSGDGMSGLPNPRSITSSPARGASTLRPAMIVKTYGGRPVIRRNSMSPRYPCWAAGPVVVVTDATAARLAGGPGVEDHLWVTNEIDVVIEIPRGSRNKYEFDHEAHVFRLDR